MSFLRLMIRLALTAGLCGIWLLAGVYLYLSPKLPDVETLRDVQLQTPMKVYTREGDLIGQFGEQKRTPLSFDQIPEQFIQDAMVECEVHSGSVRVRQNDESKTMARHPRDPR